MKYQESSSSLIRDLFFAAFAGFVMLFQLGQGSLATWDEATYGVIAREMVRSGNWLIMTYDGHVWLEKPPLGIWMIALSYKMFGISEFSVRLFSALCGWGTILVTYAIGSKLFNRWTGFLAGMFLLTAKHFTQHARLGFMDTPLVLLISLALLFFWMGREKNRFFYLSGIFLGLAFLTKGFAALLVIPVTWIYCAWAGELSILKKPSYWLGILLGLGVVIPWNAYAVFRDSQQYASDFQQQVLQRFMKPIEDHPGGLGFYFKVMTNKFRPWIFLVFPALPFFVFKAIRMKSKEMIFITVWILCAFGMWTLVRTKLHWYILPIYPALSISLAYVFARIVKEKYVLPVALMFFLSIAGHAKRNVFAANYSVDLKAISAQVQALVPEGKTVALYNSNDRSTNFFYSERPTVSLTAEKDLVTAAQQSDFYCLIKKKDLGSLTIPLADLHAAGRASAGELVLLTKG